MVKVIIKEMKGEFNIHFYGKCGYLIHIESFFGNTTSEYARRVRLDKDSIVSHSAKMISKTGHIEYEVVE